MKFIVLAYDGTDEDAPDRRLAVREEHLKAGKEMYNTGSILYATAILNENEKMIGSMIVCDFDSLDDLKGKWLDKEPYVTGNVWQNIEIKHARVASFCLK